MTAATDSASTPILAKSLLETWRSGDRARLSEELTRLVLAPEPRLSADEAERMDLLKSMACRMKDAVEFPAAHEQSPRVAAWMDLLGHLAKAA